MDNPEIKLEKDIHVVHDDHLAELLSSLGLERRFSEGKLLCKFCKEPVDFDTLGAIIPEAGSIKLTCDRPKCVAKLAGYLQER
jgi:hypothetical protein